MKDTYLEAGKIVNTHGIAGELKVLPWCDGPEFLLDFDTIYIDEKPVKVNSARIHKNNVLMTLAGVNNINDAMCMKNKVIYIDRSEVELPEGKNFLADILGLEAREAETGKVLGKIADILSPSVQDIYVIRGGEREYMIPAVDAFILETNVAEGYITVRLIEGL